jgi:hypothetical protein
LYRFSQELVGDHSSRQPRWLRGFEVQPFQAHAAPRSDRNAQERDSHIRCPKPSRFLRLRVLSQMTCSSLTRGNCSFLFLNAIGMPTLPGTHNEWTMRPCRDRYSVNRCHALPVEPRPVCTENPILACRAKMVWPVRPIPKNGQLHGPLRPFLLEREPRKWPYCRFGSAQVNFKMLRCKNALRHYASDSGF